MTAARFTPGATSLSNSRYFPLVPYSALVKQVVLPPGSAKLSTLPAPTGSCVCVNTIGTVRLAWSNAATHVPPSGWFLLVCSLGALTVATAKRFTERAGLGDAAIRHRPALRWYRPSALLVTQWVLSAAMIAAYVAWAAGERTDAQAWHLISAVPLAAALIQFSILTARHTTAPVEDLLTRNGVMLTCELSWLALFVTGLQV